MIIPRGLGIPSTRFISRGYGGVVSTIFGETPDISVTFLFDQLADIRPFFSRLSIPQIKGSHIALADWTFSHPGEIDFAFGISTCYGEADITFARYYSTYTGVPRLTSERVGQAALTPD